jgi:hippurate hydrolase
MDPLATLLSEAEALLPEAVAMRREIHAHPELGLELPVTQARILRELEGLGLSITTGTSLSSVTAVLETGRPGPTVLLRGDMDALPMPEDTDVEFKSTIEGAMHACGHDAHVAMLAQAAKLLVDHRDELNGRVVFMFQPGEEGGGGAAIMIDEGVLDVAGSTDLAFAIHVTPSLPNKVIGTRGGTLMASADQFFIDVIGRGGHASQPHLTLDPIPVACETVLALQSMVTRKVNAFDPAVVTVAHITSGTTTNVIPERAQIEGTIRTVSAFTRQFVHAEIERVARGIAAAHGAEVDVHIELGYPVTVNDTTIATWSREIADGVIGQGASLEMPWPVMGAEDFSYVLEKVPGAMVFLGLCPDGLAFYEAAPNHSNKMVINESGMSAGIALYAGVALAKSQSA